MAESSWRGLPQEHYPTEPTFDEDTRPAERTRRASTSTSRSRRESVYDAQRGSQRRSRPVSVASQITIKSKGKRASYQTAGESEPFDEPKYRGQRASYRESGDPEHLDDTATPHPLPVDPDQSHSGHTRGRSEQSVKNFSRPDATRRRSSGASRASRKSRNQEQNLSEVSALPPLPKTQRFSAATTAQNTQHKQSRDAERGRDSEETPRPYSRRNPEELIRTEKPVPKILNELYTISYLIFFSILGTLARLGVQWITFYPGAPIVTPVVWANFGGCLIMGFLGEDQSLFREHAQIAAQAEKHDGDLQTLEKAEMTKRKKVIPLYIGLATGFCGSFTSFSSFARDFFLALSNNLPSPISHNYAATSGTLSPSNTIHRNGGYSFEALLAVIIYTLALSLGGLLVGAHTALALDRITPTLPVFFIRKIFDPAMVFLAWGCWLGAVFLAIFPPDRPGGPSSRGTWSNETWRGEVLFALVFAPLGCLLRFYASLHLNGLVSTFPLGTFAVNMFGTAIEGMCYDIQHVGVGRMGMIGGGRVGCQVLQGVQDGFCGCLTTVSTWVAEINNLKRKHGYAYAFASLVGGLCLMVIIMGSVQWSVGFSETSCNTGYPSKVHG